MNFYIYYNGFNFKHFNNGNPPPPADGGPVKSHIGLAKSDSTDLYLYQHTENYFILFLIITTVVVFA